MLNPYHNNLTLYNPPTQITEGSPLYCDDITKTQGYFWGRVLGRPVIDGVVALCKFIANLNNRFAIPGAEASSTCSQDNHFGIPLLGRITHDTLLEKFENLGTLGGGGDAIVYKVRDKGSGNLYAMSIEYQMRRKSLNQRQGVFEELFKVQDNNPHLAKTHAVFWLENKNYPFEGAKKTGTSPYEKPEEGHFIRTDYAEDPEATTYYREVMVNELGKGDLTSAEFRKLEKDPVATKIQMIFNDYLLARAGIIPSDDKDRNYIWKPTEGEYFNGRALSEYSVWHYQFGNNHLYLPRQEYIIRRVDFSRWVLTDNHLEVDWLQIIANGEDLSVDEILHRYSRPVVPDSEILDMNVEP